MSETENPGDKTLTVAPSKTLHLKRSTEHGMVRQSFSHGRSKVVVVEKVKRRAPGHVEAKAHAPAPAPAAPAPAAPPPPPAPAAKAETPRPVAPRGAGMVLRALTEEEREARARALVDARSREEEDRRQAEIDAKSRTERDERERVERQAADARKREEEERLARDAETRRRSEEEARRRLSGGAEGEAPAAPTGVAKPRLAEGAEATRVVVRRPLGLTPASAPPQRPAPSRGGEHKNRGRLTVSTATAGGDEERTRSVAAFRRRTQRLKSFGMAEQKEKISREVILPETITI